MAGIYRCVAITAAQLADTTVIHMLRTSRAQIFILRLLAVFIILITADMFLGFHKYNVKSSEIARRLEQRPSLMSIKETDLDMEGSPLFGFRQSPFLAAWANPTAFGVKIQYIGDDDSN